MNSIKRSVLTGSGGICLNKEECLKYTKIAADALNEKKAFDVKIIEIGEISTLCDYFIIGGASNKNQIEALVENVEQKLEKTGIVPRYIEGRGGQDWILLDYGDFVVHIFDEESRAFYDIEKIWSDGKLIDLLDRGESADPE